jgi:general secretion pathway protein D
MHYFTQVLKLINELDAPTAQVLIEAKILEVATDFRDRFGVRWSPDGSQVFDADDLDGSLQPSAAATFQRIFAGTGMPGALKTGVLDAGVNLDVLVQFLRKNTDATVLAEPQINVSDNELGKLFVGAQVPFISSSLNTDVGGRNDSFQYKDVGIILEVTPQINNDEDVALKIRAESSNIRSGETLFGGAILDTRNFRTDIQVKDGQSVILGGIIQKQNGEVIRKVPLLGDIPILGWAFKKKDKTVRDVELMVFLRPQITRSPADAARLLEEIDRKTPKLRRSRADMKAQAEEEAGE